MGGLRISPYGGLVRLVRGWAVAATAIVLALAGHTIAGGSAPTPRVVLALIVLAAVPCAQMSSLEWTTRRLVGVMLVAQAGLHLTFSLTAPGHPAGSPWPMVGWHVAATAVAVATLRHGETVLADLADTVGLRRYHRLRAGLPAPAKAASVLGQWIAAAVRPVPGAGPLPARGPPALS